MGQFDVDYKLFVACRDGKIYVIRNGEVTEQVFSIESKPVGLIIFEKQVIVAGMNSKITEEMIIYRYYAFIFYEGEEEFYGGNACSNY